MTRRPRWLPLAADELAIGVTCVVLAVTAAVSLHGSLATGGLPRAHGIAVTPVGTVPTATGRSLYADVATPGSALPRWVVVESYASPSAGAELTAWVCSRPWVTATGDCSGRSALVEAPGAVSRSALVAVPRSMASGDVVHFRFVVSGQLGGGDPTLAVSMAAA